MPVHEFVTYPWLIGTGLVVIAILLPTIAIWGRGKVNKELCLKVHELLDKKLDSMEGMAKTNGTEIQAVKEVVIRIESILNGKK